MARLVSLLVSHSYEPAISVFVGERAQMGLRKMLAEGSRTQADSCPGQCLSALARRCANDFPAFAVRIVGQAGWDFLERNMPPAAPHVPLTLDHIQLHEHGACEFIKNEESHNRQAKGLRGEPTPQDSFQLWTRQAYLLP